MGRTEELLEPEQNVNRRELLAALGTTGAITTAGCMGGVDDNKEDNNQENDTDQHTTTDQTNDTTTDQTDNTDDTTTDNTFNPGWNPHDILPNNPDEWHYPSRLTAVDVRQNIHPGFQLRSHPHGLDYLFELSSEEVNASITTGLPEMTEIGILQEDYTEEDFLETVNNPQSKITDANIQHQENVTYAKGEEAEAAYTTDQNERPVIITSDQIGEELQNSIDYMNSNREPIRPQHVEDDLFKRQLILLEHISGAKHYEQVEKITPDRNQIWNVDYAGEGAVIREPGLNFELQDIEL